MDYVLAYLCTHAYIFEYTILILGLKKELSSRPDGGKPGTRQLADRIILLPWRSLTLLW